MHAMRPQKLRDWQPSVHARGARLWMKLTHVNDITEDGESDGTPGLQTTTCLKIKKVITNKCNINVRICRVQTDKVCYCRIKNTESDAAVQFWRDDGEEWFVFQMVVSTSSGTSSTNRGADDCMNALNGIGFRAERPSEYHENYGLIKVMWVGEDWRNSDGRIVPSEYDNLGQRYEAGELKAEGHIKQHAWDLEHQLRQWRDSCTASPYGRDDCPCKVRLGEDGCSAQVDRCYTEPYAYGCYCTLNPTDQECLCMYDEESFLCRPKERYSPSCAEDLANDGCLCDTNTYPDSDPDCLRYTASCKKDLANDGCLCDLNANSLAQQYPECDCIFNPTQPACLDDWVGEPGQ